jgi:hypothetical protein
MSEVHIRDVLAVTKQEMKDGKVSTTTMCGEQDPEMNRLCFGDAKEVMQRKMRYPCERCRNKWVEEEESVNDQVRAVHKFRKTVAKTNNFQKMGQAKGSSSRIIRGY